MNGLDETLYKLKHAANSGSHLVYFDDEGHIKLEEKNPSRLGRMVTQFKNWRLGYHLFSQIETAEKVLNAFNQYDFRGFYYLKNDLDKAVIAKTLHAVVARLLKDAPASEKQRIEGVFAKTHAFLKGEDERANLGPIQERFVDPVARDEWISNNKDRFKFYKSEWEQFKKQLPLSRGYEEAANDIKKDRDRKIEVMIEKNGTFTPNEKRLISESLGKMPCTSVESFCKKVENLILNRRRTKVVDYLKQFPELEFTDSEIEFFLDRLKLRPSSDFGMLKREVLHVRDLVVSNELSIDETKDFIDRVNKSHDKTFSSIASRIVHERNLKLVESEDSSFDYVAPFIETGISRADLESAFPRRNMRNLVSEELMRSPSRRVFWDGVKAMVASHVLQLKKNAMEDILSDLCKRVGLSPNLVKNFKLDGSLTLIEAVVKFVIPTLAKEYDLPDGYEDIAIDDLKNSFNRLEYNLNKKSDLRDAARSINLYFYNKVNGQYRDKVRESNWNVSENQVRETIADAFADNKDLNGRDLRVDDFSMGRRPLLPHHKAVLKSLNPLSFTEKLKKAIGLSIDDSAAGLATTPPVEYVALSLEDGQFQDVARLMQPKFSMGQIQTHSEVFFTSPVTDTFEPTLTPRSESPIPSLNGSIDLSLPESTVVDSDRSSSSLSDLIIPESPSNASTVSEPESPPLLQLSNVEEQMDPVLELMNKKAEAARVFSELGLKIIGDTSSTWDEFIGVLSSSLVKKYKIISVEDVKVIEKSLKIQLNESQHELRLSGVAVYLNNYFVDRFSKMVNGNQYLDKIFEDEALTEILSGGKELLDPARIQAQVDQLAGKSVVVAPVQTEILGTPLTKREQEKLDQLVSQEPLLSSESEFPSATLPTDFFITARHKAPRKVKTRVAEIEAPNTQVSPVSLEATKSVKQSTKKRLSFW